MKKALSLVLASLLLLATLLPLTALPLSAAKDEKFTVSHRSPAIPANVGETVDLTRYDVEFSATASFAASSVSWTSEELTVTDGTVTAHSPGIYPLTAKAMGRSRTVYLVVKRSSDTEYLLYEEDFDSVASFDALGYSVVQKTNDTCGIAVKDGKLVLSGQAHGDNYVRVLLPEWLGEFANYKIDASVAMTASNGSTRWASVMFRAQNNNYPYYQHAIRYYTDADNGTELALRTTKDAWDVQYKQPYTERFSDGKYRTMTVEAYGSAIRTLIDGYELVATSSANLNDPGRIGFQVRACELSVDSIRVTLQLEEPANTSTYMAEVEDPESNIILPPSVVTEIDSRKALAALKNALNDGNVIPATAIFPLDSSLKLTGADQALTVEEILTLLDERVIPAFRIKDKATATALSEKLKALRVHDVFIVSEDAEVLRVARDAYLYNRTVLDCTGTLGGASTTKDLESIRAKANKCGARICIIPDTYKNRSDVALLQRLLMSVWVTAENTASDRVAAIVSGANGVVTSDFAALAAAYTTYFAENTIVRPSEIVGHRGVPSLAPENTVEGSMLSYELGVTIIENDVYLSKDGVVFVMHDGTIDRTTNGSGSTESFTYEELSKLVVDVDPKFGDAPIPTLEDYLKTFKGLDVALFIEIKSSNTDICQPIADLVRRYGMEDQVNVITFNTAIMKKIKEVMPEISLGYLTGSPVSDETDPTSSVERIVETVQAYDATYNPNYNVTGLRLGPNVLRAANHRGITYWPWTVNSREHLDEFFLYGTNGLTTNYAQYVSDCVRLAETAKDSYRIAIDKEYRLPVLATTYARNTVEKTHGTLVFIEGDNVFTYENGYIKASAEGKATVMLSIGCLTPGGSLCYLYTMPFTVEASANVIWTDVTDPVTTEKDPVATDPTPSDSTPTDSGTAAAPSGTEETPNVTAVTDADVEPAVSADATTEDTAADEGCGSVLSLPSLLSVLLPLLAVPVIARTRRD